MGFDCHAASVSPTASAWDRACELYAQLTGTRTDYGKVHSARFGHARYGRDFSGQPLDREQIRPGIWNVFPTVDGDHMFLQGGLMRRHDIRPFYLDLLNLIEQTLPVD